MKTRTTANKDWDLSGLTVGGDTGVPKYLQLRNSLSAAIAEGRWKAGAKLPPEDALTGATGLSLGTVQRALQALADDGVLVRRQGIGTFVARAETPMNAPFYHCRFLDAEGRQLPIFSKALRRHPATGEGEWSCHLQGLKILCIDRLFSINKEFNIYTHLYIDAARFPTLAEMPIAKLHGLNFKELISREYHLPLARFSENMSVSVFPPHICKAIGVARRTAGAVLEIVARDPRGEPVYYQDLYIPPSQRRLFIA